MSEKHSEFTIVGGGVVGLSIAMGLLQKGQQVTVLDGDDSDLRASQGNFGLIWLQGKGSDFAPYARWTHNAVMTWPDFAKSLEALSGVNLALDQSGGYEFFTDAAEFAAFQADLKQQQIHLGNRSSYEIISGNDLRRTYSGIGEGVVGATFCPLDGHVNPLRLLSALRIAVVALGGTMISDARVTQVLANKSGSFELSVQDGRHFKTERVILAAGLGTNPLAKQLSFITQVRPQRGELLITEKLSERLPFLSSTIRQVDEGGLQIGGSKEDAGLNDSETLDVMARLAQHAVAIYPPLADVRMVRAWGALRIISPDGYPVYAQSPEHPGAYLVTCHSGVTLASLHSTLLAQWLIDSSNSSMVEAFNESRFALSVAA